MLLVVQPAEVQDHRPVRRRQAADAGVGERIAWERHELGHTFPDGTFDLVSAHYLQSPVDLDLYGILRRAAAAVTPGGTLLITLHGTWPTWMHEPPFDGEFPTLDGLLAELALPDETWTVVTAQADRKPSVSPEGVEGHREDNVWRLRRK
ncbi:Methyltransferase OS=Streptomyces glaucescens OX=1907 GN=SGLAU_02390 PE=4 SV=1 [Streptomyces glaucescens]